MNRRLCRWPTPAFLWLSWRRFSAPCDERQRIPAPQSRAIEMNGKLALVA